VVQYINGGYADTEELENLNWTIKTKPGCHITCDYATKTFDDGDFDTDMESDMEVTPGNPSLTRTGPRWAWGRFFCHIDGVIENWELFYWQVEDQDS